MDRRRTEQFRLMTPYWFQLSAALRKAYGDQVLVEMVTQSDAPRSTLLSNDNLKGYVFILFFNAVITRRLVAFVLLASTKFMCKLRSFILRREHLSYDCFRVFYIIYSNVSAFVVVQLDFAAYTVQPVRLHRPGLPGRVRHRRRRVHLLGIDHSLHRSRHVDHGPWQRFDHLPHDHAQTQTGLAQSS